MYRRRMLLMLPVVVMLFGAASQARSEALDLILPTSNRALLHGDGPAFYQYTDRTFNGVQSRPWEGGQYGFVRNPKETRAGVVFTRFHEGVDIKPIYRDFRDEPLDTVRAIDTGYVVYTNTNERASAYGKYVVVEHWWSGSPFYSLYAHLNSIEVREGQRVRQGHRLGRLGYTGTGLDRRRAHLHFEINMLLNRNFEKWFDEHYRGSNRHAMFHGLNLSGINVAELYLALDRDPRLSIEDFIARQEPFFKIAVPNEGPLDLTHRYEWLVDSRQVRQIGGQPASWEISFTESGVPIRIEPSMQSVSEPTVTTIRRANVSYAYLTGGLVDGSYDRYYLGPSGRRHASLLMLADTERQIVQSEMTTVMEASDLGEVRERLRRW